MPRDCAPPAVVGEVTLPAGRRGRIVAADDAGQFRVDLVAHDWVTRLASVGWLDRDQVEAAERLRDLFDQADLRPKVTSSYDTGRIDAGSAGFGLERHDERRTAARRQLDCMLSHVANRDRANVEAVVLWDVAPPDLQALQRGLSAVAQALRHPRRR